MKKYVTYESPFENQIFNEKEMFCLYTELVDKMEYPTYTDWITDMVNYSAIE